MKTNGWKKDNSGMTLIKLILLILVTILVVFLAYEIFYVDLFGIVKKANNPIDVISSFVGNNIENEIQNVKDNENSSQNVEVITPIVNENQYQSSENANTVNHYYYNQLDESGKIIYKGLEDNIDNMKSGNYKIDFDTQFNELLNSDNGEQKLNVSFQSAWNAFTYDYVDIFYIDVTKLILTTRTTTIGSFSTHKVSLSNDGYTNYFSEGISTETELRKREKYVQNMRNQIVSSLQEYSEYEQVKYLHDWIIDNFEYDTTYKKSDIHNIYGALANKKVVCEGYARTFKYILDGLGIENVLVSGTATNSNDVTESHAWNYVKVDGKWYAVDVTWDDPVIKGEGNLTDKLRYQYFLKGANSFLKNHVEDGYLSKNSIKFVFPSLEKKNYVR